MLQTTGVADTKEVDLAYPWLSSADADVLSDGSRPDILTHIVCVVQGAQKVVSTLLHWQFWVALRDDICPTFRWSRIGIMYYKMLNLSCLIFPCTLPEHLHVVWWRCHCILCSCQSKQMGTVHLSCNYLPPPPPTLKIPNNHPPKKTTTTTTQNMLF